MPLPPRNADTMSDAIALSSPSGRMSKRARAAAEKRLAAALFGDEPLTGRAPEPPTLTAREKLDKEIAYLNGLVERKLLTRRKADNRIRKLTMEHTNGTSTE